MPCQNVQTSQNNFQSFHRPQTTTVQMQTSPCLVCSRNTQGTCVHESTGQFFQSNPYASNQQAPPATPYQPIFQAPCNIPTEFQTQPNQASLPPSILEQIRACVSNAAPIFIIPAGCHQPAAHQQPSPMPATQQPPISPSMGYSVNFQHPNQQPVCYPPSFLPYPFPLPVYENHRSSCVERSQNCGCCPKRNLEALDFKPPSSCCHAGQVEEHRCTETTDDTVCTKRNCPSALNLQALASQFLSMQGVIPCAATRLVLRKVPGSNVTSTMEETMDRAQKSISVLTKDQLLVESRSAQQVNALICLHMTANPPPNIVPILTLVQLKVNLLKAQVESLINRKLMESQGYGIEVETTGPMDPTILALKTDGELRQLLSALRQKECDERVNLNFSPYHSQRVIAESRLRTVQSKISQVEAEFERRRCTVLPAPTMSARVAQQFSTCRPCEEFRQQNLFVNVPPNQAESPDPFSTRSQNPRRLNLKPHVGSPETTYDRPETKKEDQEVPRVSTGEHSKEDAAKEENSSMENCTCRGWSTSEESLVEEKKKLRARIEEGREVAISGEDDPRIESTERISRSFYVETAAGNLGERTSEKLDLEEVQKTGMEVTRDVDLGRGKGVPQKSGIGVEEKTVRYWNSRENCACSDDQTSGSRFAKKRRELRLRIDRCGNLRICAGNETRCVPLRKLLSDSRISGDERGLEISRKSEESKKLTFLNPDETQTNGASSPDSEKAAITCKTESKKEEESIIINSEAESCDKLLEEIDETRVKIARDEDSRRTKGGAERKEIKAEAENTGLQGNAEEFQVTRNGESNIEGGAEARTSMRNGEETSDIVQLVNGDDVKIERHYGAPPSGEMERNKRSRKIPESEGEFGASFGSSQQAESRSGLFTSYLRVELKSSDTEGPVEENSKCGNSGESVESKVDPQNNCQRKEANDIEENIVSMMTNIAYDKPHQLYEKWLDTNHGTFLDSREIHRRGDATLIRSSSRRFNVKREIRKGGKFLPTISEKASFSARDVVSDLRVSDSHKPGTEGNANEVKRLADMKVDADQNTITRAAIETAENLSRGEKPITSPSRSGRDWKTLHRGNEETEDNLLSEIYSLIGHRAALLGSLIGKIMTLRHVLPILRFPMPSRIKLVETSATGKITSNSKNCTVSTSRLININDEDQCQKLFTNKHDFDSPTDNVRKTTGDDSPSISMGNAIVRVHKIKRLIVVNRKNRRKILIGGSIDDQRRVLLKHGLKKPYKIRKSVWLRSRPKDSQNYEDDGPMCFTTLKESRKETENIFAPGIVKKNRLESEKQYSLNASKKFWFLPAKKKKEDRINASKYPKSNVVFVTRENGDNRSKDANECRNGFKKTSKNTPPRNLKGIDIDKCDLISENIRISSNANKQFRTNTGLNEYHG
ncbi:hypothetical protein KM043_005099 [Ampulex compressa]|nr:hypothetical protein KM043_005099 [Ampulex compressa]